MVSDKLLKIKKWIGLDEAAERLSSIVEGRVTVLDLIELGLSRDLTLSVRLPYGEKFVGRKMAYKEVPIINHYQEIFLFRLSCEKNLKCSSKEDVLSVYEEEFKAYLLEEFEKSVEKLSAIHGPDYKEMTLESYLEKGVFGDYEYITGPEYLTDVIYDLPMIGAEVLDVQQIYSINKGYESKGLIIINGPFLRDADGQLINLMEAFEKGKIKKDKNGNKRLFEMDEMNFFPTDGLPVNSELGLRPENLIAFERSVTETPEPGGIGFGYLVGSMLSVMKNTNSKQRRWTQDLLKEELVEACPHFTRRALDDYFAEANKIYKDKFN
ncbi:hypothetical protein QUG91_11460 [Klebsiella michiganensis]|uniref:hypothetical protein n=1 Tax=Klebsiella michiganensis TaxID=1134687 RepID=UPI0025A18C2E|nr:hypothetical protein [Klebsiella michiganensis]MDM6923525.1 hypothetical protein [Klebsiella michiganensis]